MAQGTPSSVSATPRRFTWRRWFQYSLRTLLIVTTVMAIGLGWWSHAARRQRDAVAALKKTHAYIAYDFEEEKIEACKSRRYWPGNPPRVTWQFRGGDDKGLHYWPTWLVNALGVDYFACVKAVGLGKPTDAAVDNLTGLHGLETLFLSETDFSDVGLEHIKRMKGLQSLDLAATEISDAGLEHLEGLTALKWLDLTDTKVTDVAIARLKKSLPNCTIRHCQSSNCP